MTPDSSTETDSERSISTMAGGPGKGAPEEIPDGGRSVVDSEEGSAGGLIQNLTQLPKSPARGFTEYLGYTSILVGILAVIGGLGNVGYSLQITSGSELYWMAREYGLGLVAAGIPFVLSGIVLESGRSRRLALSAGFGIVTSVSGVSLFMLAYPENWRLTTQSLALWAVGSYGVGFTVLILSAGIALGQRSQSDREGGVQGAPSSGPTSSRNDTAADVPREMTKEPGGSDGHRATQEETPDRLEGTTDDGLPELHSTLVAAPSVTLESKAAMVGEQWVKTLLIVDYPDVAATGMLDQALTRVPDIDLDYSIHVNPRDPTRTIGELKKSIRDLKVKQAEKAERGDVTQIDTEQTLEDHQAIYSQLVEGSQGIFDVSIYLTVRGDEQEEVEQAAERVTRNLQTAQMTAKSATFRQDDALVSTSPIAKDILGQSATMLGGAVGGLYPFSSGTIIEESGVLMGYHSVTGSPVVVDRFAREKGYNCFIAGNTGAGKTFNTILGLLRTYAKDEDTMVIVADPFGDLGALTDILDGERVVLSGKRGLNPLEITPTPESVLEENPDLDPYTKTVQKDVMEFIQTFFSMEDMSLAGKRGVLSVAIKEAYRRRGITPDPATHHNDSPTFRDILDVLNDIAQDPTEYIGDDPELVPDIEADLWLKRASQLRMDLAPFREGGEYANLARETEIDLTGSDVLYLDMQQIEGKQQTGLMLQLVLRAVYEQAKQTDKKVIFAIDEAHYLMQNEASLSFLERATRHSRHYDLSLQLITQTVDEFFSRADSDELAQKTKAIADNCVLKIFHQVEGLTDANASEWLDLAPPEAQFIRNAKPGSEEYGYSQALIEVGEAGRFPVNVHALPEEEALIHRATPGESYEQSQSETRESSPVGSAHPSSTESQDDASEPTDELSNLVANGLGRGDEPSEALENDENRENPPNPDSSRTPSGGVDEAELASAIDEVDPVKLREFLSQEALKNLDNPDQGTQDE